MVTTSSTASGRVPGVRVPNLQRPDVRSQALLNWNTSPILQNSKQQETRVGQEPCYLSPPIHGDREGGGFSQAILRKNPLGYRNRSRVRKHFHFATISESPRHNLRREQVRAVPQDSAQAVEQRGPRTPPRSPRKLLYHHVNTSSAERQELTEAERNWAATYQYFDYWVFYRIEAHKQKLRALSQRMSVMNY